MTWFKSLGGILASMVLVVSFAVAEEVLTFDNEELRQRYNELVFELRCPKCQNQNVADSNAPISVDIRQKTYEMLHQGYSNREIVDFMIDRYTEFVTYKPQMSVVTIWLWIVPSVVLISGLFLLFRLARKTQPEGDEALTEEEKARLKALLEDKS